ncbi:MAG: hypothetical protein U9Q83_11815 [Bacteroidota bacterium]|nr:hypothetical protein [Bacteroidota bacterium]
MKKLIYIVFTFAFVLMACNNQNAEDNSYDFDSGEEEVNIESAETVLSNFLEYLGAQRYSDAYAQTNNPDWGSYDKFKSKKSFGGITGIYVKEMKVVYEGGYNATIYAEVKYIDPTNGTNTFKQNFFLEKSGEVWLITKMELVKSKSNSNTGASKPQVGQYGYSNSRSGATLKIKVIGSNYFEYDIYVGTSTCTGELYDERAIYKNGQWYSDFEDDCTVSFVFSRNSVKITETNCIGGYLHGMSCSFNGTYYKE